MQATDLEAALIAQNLFQQEFKLSQLTIPSGAPSPTQYTCVSEDGRFAAVFDLGQSDPGDITLSGYDSFDQFWYGVSVISFSLFFDPLGNISSTPSASYEAYFSLDPDLEREIWYKSPTPEQQKVNIDDTFLPHFLDKGIDYKDATYPLQAPSSIFFNEGESFRASLVTSKLLAGQVLFWKIEGENISIDDFTADSQVGSTLSGSVQLDINGNQDLSIVVREDLQTEGTEAAKVRLFLDSAFTKQVGSDIEILITDTSTSPPVVPPPVAQATSPDPITGAIEIQPNGSTITLDPNVAEIIRYNFPSVVSALAPTLKEFNPTQDKIQLLASQFKGLKSTRLTTAASRKQLKKLKKGMNSSKLVYNQKTGELFFDENGKKKGFGLGGRIGIFEDLPALASSNFEII